MERQLFLKKIKKNISVIKAAENLKYPSMKDCAI